tara:strand:- start:184 stop:855 length:672 start_codon:yes stop_codon:yes gene_type:complete
MINFDKKIRKRGLYFYMEAIKSIININVQELEILIEKTPEYTQGLKDYSLKIKEYDDIKKAIRVKVSGDKGEKVAVAEDTIRKMKQKLSALKSEMKQIRQKKCHYDRQPFAKEGWELDKLHERRKKIEKTQFFLPKLLETTGQIERHYEVEQFLLNSEYKQLFETVGNFEELPVENSDDGNVIFTEPQLSKRPRLEAEQKGTQSPVFPSPSVGGGAKAPPKVE